MVRLEPGIPRLLHRRGQSRLDQGTCLGVRGCVSTAPKDRERMACMCLCEVAPMHSPYGLLILEIRSSTYSLLVLGVIRYFSCEFLKIDACIYSPLETIEEEDAHKITSTIFLHLKTEWRKIMTAATHQHHFSPPKRLTGGENIGLYINWGHFSPNSLRGRCIIHSYQLHLCPESSRGR